MADPKYVRLPERLLTGNVTDLVTGWGISGLDVKEFPADDEQEIAYVRGALRSQLLEPATAAEFRRVRDAHERVASLAEGAVPKEGSLGTPAPWNEAAIQQVSKKVRNDLLRKRLVDADEEDDEPARSNAEPTGYADQHKAELVAEIERRNAEREADAQIPTSGNKEELVKRLQDDDEASAANTRNTRSERGRVHCRPIPLVRKEK
jgi:type IV secretory pathway VirB10-like protein